MARKPTRTTKLIATLLFVLCGLIYALRSASELDHEKRCNYVRKRAQASEARGDLASAKTEFGEAVAEAEKSQNPLQLPGVLIDLARVHAAENDRDSAEKCLLRVISTYETLPSSINDSAGDLNTLVTQKQQFARAELARLYIRDGKLKEAKALYETAIANGANDLKKEYVELLKKMGDRQAPEVEGRLETDFPGFFFVGVTAVQQGRLDKAERELATAIEIARSGENDRQLLQAVPYMALIQAERGNNVEAEKLVGKALDEVEAPLQFSREFAECLQLQACFSYLRGNKALATKIFRECIDLNASQAAKRGLIPALKECLKRRHPEYEDMTLHQWIFLEHKQMFEKKIVDAEAILSTLGEEACAVKRPVEGEMYFYRAAKLEGKAPNIASLTPLQVVVLAHSFEDIRNYPASLRLWDEIIKRGDPTANASMVVYRCKAYCLYHQSKLEKAPEIAALLRKQWEYFNDQSIYTPRQLDEDIDLIQECSLALGKNGDRLRFLNEALSHADRTWHLPVLYEHLLSAIGEEQLRRNQFERAATTFSHLLAVKTKAGLPRDALIETECRLLLCLQSSGDDERAKALVKTVLDQGCGDIARAKRCKAFALFNSGAIAAKNAKFEVADASYARAREECTQTAANCAAVILVVRSLAFNRKYAALERLAKGQIAAVESSGSKQSTEFASLLLALAESYKQEGRLKQADQSLRQALAVYLTLSSANVSVQI